MAADCNAAKPAGIAVGLPKSDPAKACWTGTFHQRVLFSQGRPLVVVIVPTALLNCCCADSTSADCESTIALETMSPPTELIERPGSPAENVKNNYTNAAPQLPLRPHPRAAAMAPVSFNLQDLRARLEFLAGRALM